MTQQRSSRLWLSTMTVVLLGIGAAPARAADDETGVWIIASASDVFESQSSPSRWSYWFDAQARYVDLDSGANQWLLRPGLGYAYTENVSLWAGYSRFRTRGRTGAVVDEDRWWQHVTWRAGHGLGGNLSFRARLEQRTVSFDSDIRVILRLQGRYSRPISDNTSLVLAIEPFFDVVDTDWGGPAGFEQNRISIGINRRLNSAWSLEAGYMNQFVRPNAGNDRSIHLGVINLRYRP